MKGIVLAGGSGTRLHPATSVISKQILPVYNKPMIYYPLSVLMLSGIREIQIISTPQHIELFTSLLGDGSSLGITLDYAVQKEPKGIAEAFLVGSDHIGDDPCALILGDNIFHGPGLYALLRRSIARLDGCVLFGYPVKDPERYGVAEVDAEGRLTGLTEKPSAPRSGLAVTGLYFYDNEVVDIAKNIRPSPRGELEITDVNRVYLEQGRAHLVDLGRGFAWLDTGTHDSLLKASQYVQVLEERQGVWIAGLEEIAFRMGFIDADACHRLGLGLSHTDYGTYLMEIAGRAAP
ncbi:glucose-1-phosphate thymidylyltransferase RfbA [Streptomyces sp. RY43-2]|uniref:Glucose-1-phosphate thymidylyltransferase n=1 Tax=Streptomyces macrolidinus TaxID=2952607 RepID=A0ABT0ZL99_9ACTN|nr:glucose-1-phosphate thymidylyltransferase RfbA [Streptomyces macrolidinus]MCN9244368.1 glucose-1-phosphate thymidylyltransferase RfbA [Streptomyces macrolidinus]